MLAWTDVLFDLVLACLIFSVIAFTFSSIMNECFHPKFDSDVFMTEYHQSLINISFSSLIMSLAKVTMPNMFYSNLSEHSLSYSLFTSIIFILSYDTLSYWTHVLMHRSWLYKRFHSLHHQYQPVMSVSSSATTLLDSLIGAQVPLWLPIILFNFIGGLYVGIFYVTILFAMVWSLYIHSILEYQATLGIFVSNAEHLSHHQDNKYNYGTLFRAWDYLCATQKSD